MMKKSIFILLMILVGNTLAYDKQCSCYFNGIVETITVYPNGEVEFRCRVTQDGYNANGTHVAANTKKILPSIYKFCPRSREYSANAEEPGLFRAAIPLRV